MLYRPLYLQQPPELLSSSTDIDLFLVKVGCHDLWVFWSTDTGGWFRLAPPACLNEQENLKIRSQIREIAFWLFLTCETSFDRAGPLVVSYNSAHQCRIL